MTRCGIGGTQRVTRGMTKHAWGAACLVDKPAALGGTQRVKIGWELEASLAPDLAQSG